MMLLLLFAHSSEQGHAPIYAAEQANGHPEAFPFHWKASSTLSPDSVTSRNSTA
jgi:hypothetical protein